MSTRYLNADRDTPMLLPPDGRDWMAHDDLAPFIFDAVPSADVSLARVNLNSAARTSEPTFPIVKRLMGFGWFMRRGLEKVNLEWNLVALADNCRKLAPLGR